MAWDFLQVPKRRSEAWRRTGEAAGQERAQHEWRTFWRFFPYIFPYKSKVILGMLLVVVGVGAGEVVETVGKEYSDVLFAFQEKPLGTGHAVRVGFGPLRGLGFRGPVLVGVGVGTPEQAVEASAHGDGVVVGSAIVERMLDGAGPEGVAELVRGFRTALDAAYPPA